MTDQDLSKIEVPKNLRLNMKERRLMAEQMAARSMLAAREGYNSEAVQRDLSERVYAAIWVKPEYLEMAKSMPKGFFQKRNHVNVTVGKVGYHQTGMSEDDVKEYVSNSYKSFTFDFGDGAGKEKRIFPESAERYFAICDKNTKTVKKWRNGKNNEFDNENVFKDRALEKDLYDFITFDERVTKAGDVLEQKVSSALREIKTVKDLQDTWPELFEVYHDLFSAKLGGSANALVKHVPVSEVAKMIADFPDIKDLMAA